eukprot:TRINITY_DN7333_c0_g1_i3.p1 TRINITY_DN7333_c0_g1~~TRINITY_DN7333_c0_g1_i3.p1  ORF type:complete len:358 (+),score=89.45 TRINITY_DN7333_c0_g1_i3:462-1535(+)
MGQGKCVDVPIYDFTTHSRSSATERIYGADVIVIEGILVFFSAELRDEMDMKIFVDCDPDVRLSRRIIRDVKERGRDVDGIIAQYLRFVKTAFDDFILPSKKYADIIVPRGIENVVAINLLVQHIKEKLKAEGHVTWETMPVATIPPSTQLLPQSHQVKALMTILRDRRTELSDFVFYSDRLCRLLLETAIDSLPFQDTTILTPTDAPYHGHSFDWENVCAISVFRGGGCMVNPLKEMINNITIGQLLIQSHHKIPRLFLYSIPNDLQNKQILLLEPTIATAATIIMAIQTLLDHGAQESNIILVCVIAATHGLQTIYHHFPKVKITTAAIDYELNDQGYIVPGIGNYADRYLGTDL